jgi:hypothetical protein
VVLDAVVVKKPERCTEAAAAKGRPWQDREAERDPCQVADHLLPGRERPRWSRLSALFIASRASPGLARLEIITIPGPSGWTIMLGNDEAAGRLFNPFADKAGLILPPDDVPPATILIAASETRWHQHRW